MASSLNTAVVLFRKSTLNRSPAPPAGSMEHRRGRGRGRGGERCHWHLHPTAPPCSSVCSAACRQQLQGEAGRVSEGIHAFAR